jgi:hypothetical protein
MKRQEVAERFAKHYPRALAELIAAVAQPFDSYREINEASFRAQKAARQEVRGLFPLNAQFPPGGEVETRLCTIAKGLVETLSDDAGAGIAALRIKNALAQLTDAMLAPAPFAINELVVPDAAENLNGIVPFGMWR